MRTFLSVPGRCARKGTVNEKLRIAEISTLVIMFPLFEWIHTNLASIRFELNVCKTSTAKLFSKCSLFFSIFIVLLKKSHPTHAAQPSQTISKHLWLSANKHNCMILMLITHQYILQPITSHISTTD